MFNGLGPLFKTVFRQTEHADARLEIRREEKEDGRKKKEGEEELSDSIDLWEDSTAVSVEALHTFLIEFLKNQNAPVPASEAAATSSDDFQPLALSEQKPPVSSVAARAVKAYTSMTIQTQYIPPPAVPTPEVTTNKPASTLRPDEIRTIHMLIAELDAIGKTGVQTLNIQMTGTFLESVADAVRAYKAGL